MPSTPCFRLGPRRPVYAGGVGNPPIDGDDYSGAAAAFRDAWRRLLAAVHVTQDPQQHFDRATETGTTLAGFVEENAAERAGAAIRIKEAEGLTLAALGKRISMTKQRAGRLTGKARQPGKEQ